MAHGWINLLRVHWQPHSFCDLNSLKAHRLHISLTQHIFRQEVQYSHLSEGPDGNSTCFPPPPCKVDSQPMWIVGGLQWGGRLRGRNCLSCLFRGCSCLFIQQSSTDVRGRSNFSPSHYSPSIRVPSDPRNQCSHVSRYCWMDQTQ